MKLSLCFPAALASLVSAHAAVASTGPHFDVRDASARYDFRLLLREECAPDKSPDGICEAPGAIEITPKRGGSPMQRLDLERIDVVLEGGRPVVNAQEVYGDVGTLEVGDFDFDGHEDFAVQDGQDGPYGGPTFQVFLYRPAEKRFVRSQALSQLTQVALGFFQVDAKQRVLVTYAKSGCCLHETDRYRMNRGEPMLVWRHIEDATGDDVIDTTERLQGAHWVTTSERHPLDAE